MAFYNTHARKNSRRNILRIIFSFMLIFTMVFTVVPGGILKAYAAPLEDCDLDGLDDATGVPVPWPGYDETKGDTPNGRGGGQASSSTPAKTTSSAPGKAASSAPEKTASSAPAQTGNSTPGKSASSAPAKTGGTTSGKTGSTAPDNTGSTASSGTGSSVSSKADEQSTVSQNEQTAGNSDTLGTENNNAASKDVESVVNTKGSLEIKEANNSVIHAGSSVIVSGSGFTGNIDDLEIEIQSEPRRLGTVASSGDGSFQAKINIPEDLEAGTHHIVVLYQGKEIISQQIQIGPKAANSFLQALSVGFSKDNNGFIPGILILAGLSVLGLVALLVNGLAHSRRGKSLS